MRISDWSSDVCSSDLHLRSVIDATLPQVTRLVLASAPHDIDGPLGLDDIRAWRQQASERAVQDAGFAYEGYVRLKLGAVLEFVAKLVCASCRYSERSEEHTSELQSLMRISYAVFCLKKKKKENT